MGLAKVSSRELAFALIETAHGIGFVGVVDSESEFNATFLFSQDRGLDPRKTYARLSFELRLETNRNPNKVGGRLRV